MTNPERAALDAYYREADSWATNALDAQRRSKRIAWTVAGIATTVALFEAAALMLVAPLKTVVPYTLLVDRTTGFVQELKPIEANRVSPDSALAQSFLVQYVVARESFDINALQANYRKVSLWSAGAARAAYVGSVQASNPDSPLARNPRSTVVETRVKSVTSLDPSSALVRFETIRRDAGGQAGVSRNWVAIIRYRFSQQPLQVEDRFTNPLGFQVERYQRSQEAVATVESGEAQALPRDPAVANVMAAPVALRSAPAPVSTTVVAPSPTSRRGQPVFGGGAGDGTASRDEGRP